jgi:hypothetical protein
MQEQRYFFGSAVSFSNTDNTESIISPIIYAIIYALHLNGEGSKISTFVRF